MLRFLSMNDIKGGIRDSEVNQFPVEEEESEVSLVLGGGGDIFFDGWMGEEFFDFRQSHFSWMKFIVKEDVTANPLYTALFGAVEVMPGAECLSYMLE